ncbi:acetyl-coenzyme A carboxylase carboxyl transferase subunit alpha, chloroplastic [Neltuma alba]|uniref:acetyl-coenzyme A carboxylase carboxyl transferase subunit alpha, chloroplastic n=1 Tax=Neltuma alba TaxID=207710 RepID=UPI0010A38311|nr:acetyl-coenzyme A carboxylase carboxyl transferase subunit alpha, chloroplastic [Prosopis alba]XP_028783429.1 acetyl-coenzyme A carboxylase carboxyl transferase subunit alpha, chloroplastic [Prosopis alba]XP_028783430.1 acetyl-coenzyme A carboxylase carboxyl transferase subunit alpha, chloroplastic [Prosopis alba]XP_028783431.1 acetyl-coenzyme A carboxylase carboxyl transferase subunit alpha, chloroplastic [Prosopis alba]
MASASHGAVAFAGTSASDLLRSSTNGVSGVSLKTLGRLPLKLKRRDFTVSAKIKKGKKHEYPWPDNPDPDVKGGVLTHLSHFKPLKEKQKPVTLDFERPLVELEKKINDVRKMAKDTGLDFSDQIILLETKYQQALKDLYARLTPIQRVGIARHPNRPTFLDHIFNITDKFVELHGDRAGYDDPAIVTGIGTIDGRRYMFIGQQKGRNTKENIQRNFGMPTPHGYRKALRMMYYADHHGFPIITFIDTPGAYADLKSEELGQGEAIAHNLRTMFGLKVPIVSIVIGEGGSGGALAIGCANKLLMLENAVFYVASPEACAAILWKTSKASPQAAEKLRITAKELCKLQVADGVIPEPLGGAHADPSWTSQQIKFAINETMDELTKMETEDLLKHRMLKYRKIGGVQEGVAIDPKWKVNMKKKEQPDTKRIPDAELEGEVEKLKEQILKAKTSTTKPPESDVEAIIQQVKDEVDQEYSEAVKAMGLMDKLVKLREEVSKANAEDQLIHPVLKDKIEKLKEEFNQRLSAAPNYERLQNKLGILKKLSQVKFLADRNKKAVTLKQDFSAKLEDIINSPSIKEKYETLKAEVEGSGVSSPRDLDDKLKKKIIEFKKEVELQLVDALKSKGLEVEIVKAKAQDNIGESSLSLIEELNKDVYKGIENALNSPGLKSKIELLKMEVAKAGNNLDLTLKNRIVALEQQIKQSLAETMSTSSLKEKFDSITSKTSSMNEFSGESDEDPAGDGLTHDELREKVGANRTYS